ncbi:MAG TPA: methyltransferase domain-containing protein [Alphaproteobacteria bacterium]|nr:methyltransferase domain-containing protein [Alphaproteobacteria bacterium]
MYTDVVDLRDFYDTALGQVVVRLLRRQIRLLWDDVRGQRVLGLGYAGPFLRPFMEEAERVLSVMPAEQGVVRWPRQGRGLVALAEETELPFPDASIDRVLMVHCVESTSDLRALMREIWRVLAGGGRVLAVVPNRRGLWARFETTPFGNGNPFSAGQISRALRDNMFTPERTAQALFVPPMASRVMLRTAGAWEAVGVRWFKTFAGVVMIEATKQIYAAPLARRPRRRRLLVPVPVGAPLPAPAPSMVGADG